jgi:short-subunit dehydrogenase
MRSDQKGVALITGATSGIGAAYAEAYAARGLDLIITGRRQKEIAAVAERLRDERGVAVEVVTGDLADESHLASLARRIRATKDLEVLVNNAGFGVDGEFVELDESVHAAMLAVHAAATMRLTYAALPGMIGRGRGTVINVSSIGGFIPFPGNAMYGGTKAFVRYFTESLHLELLGTGVKVQALCPGMTRTDFHTKMGLDREGFYQTGGLMKAMTPHEVVEVSLGHLEKDDPICVPGMNNRITFLLCRILPRRVLYRIVMSWEKDRKTDRG